MYKKIIFFEISDIRIFEILDIRIFEQFWIGFLDVWIRIFLNTSSGE